MPKLDLQKLREAGVNPRKIQTYITTHPDVEVYDSAKESQKGFQASDLAPIAGGILGGVAGSVLGPAGTIIGGGLGSSAGEFVRQKLTPEDDNNVGRVLSEGAFGLAGGAAGKIIGAGGRLAGRALTQKLPERIMGSVFKEPVKQTSAAISKGGSLGQESLERGTRGTTKQIYETSVKQIDNTENTLQEVLTTSNKKVPISDIRKTVKPLIDEYKQSGNVSAANALEQRIAAIEAQAGKSIPAARANQIKRSLYQEADKAYGTEASANMEGIKAIARGIKESLDDVPGVSQLNKDLSFYGRQRNSMLDKMTRDERNQLIGLSDLPLVAGGLINAPAAIGLYGAKKIAGSTVGKTTIAQGLNKAGELAGKIPAAVGTATSQTLGQPLARIPQALVGEQSRDNGIDTKTNKQQDFHTLGDIPQTTGQSQIQVPKYLNPYGKSPEELYAKHREAADMGNKKLADDLLKIFNTELAYQKANKPASQKGLTEGQALKKDLADSGLSALQVLKNEVGYNPKTGKVNMGEINKFRLVPFDLANRTLSKALFDSVASRLRIETGAAISDEEIKRYIDKYFFRLGDDEKAINYQIQFLEEFLNRFSGSQTPVAPTSSLQEDYPGQGIGESPQSFNSPEGGEQLGNVGMGGTQQLASVGSGATQSDIVSLIKKHFPQDQWQNAWNIMMAETGGQNIPSTFNQQGTEDSHGLFQINLDAHPQMAGKVYNPEANIAYAAKLYRESGWYPWLNSARKVGLIA